MMKAPFSAEMILFYHVFGDICAFKEWRSDGKIWNNHVKSLGAGATEVVVFGLN